MQLAARTDRRRRVLPGSGERLAHERADASEGRSRAAWCVSTGAVSCSPQSSSPKAAFSWVHPRCVSGPELHRPFDAALWSLHGDAPPVHCVRSAADLLTMRWGPTTDPSLPGLPGHLVDPAASALADGSIVVVGGEDDRGVLGQRRPPANPRAPQAITPWLLRCPGPNTAEPRGCDRRPGVSAAVLRWEPGAAGWAKLPPMQQERVGCIAVLLPRGGLLVAGGRDEHEALASAEVLERSEQGVWRWAPAGAMACRRVRPAAGISSFGVLVAGGAQCDRVDDEVPAHQQRQNQNMLECFNPATKSWSVLESPQDPRLVKLATPLALPVGGGLRRMLRPALLISRAHASRLTLVEIEDMDSSGFHGDDALLVSQRRSASSVHPVDRVPADLPKWYELDYAIDVDPASGRWSTAVWAAGPHTLQGGAEQALIASIRDPATRSARVMETQWRPIPVEESGVPLLRGGGRGRGPAMIGPGHVAVRGGLVARDGGRTLLYDLDSRRWLALPLRTAVKAGTRECLGHALVSMV